MWCAAVVMDSAQPPPKGFMRLASLQPAANTAAERTICLFAPFYISQDFSDLVLKAQRTQVHVHKVVIAAHSASLQAMLQVRAATNMFLHCP